MSRRAPRPLSMALDRLTESIVPPSTLGRLQTIWPRLVGEAIAAEASPIAERVGMVTVACSSSVWAAELRMMEADLLAKLNDELGEDAAVAGVRWVTRR